MAEVFRTFTAIGRRSKQCSPICDRPLLIFHGGHLPDGCSTSPAEIVDHIRDLGLQRVRHSPPAVSLRHGRKNACRQTCSPFRLTSAHEHPSHTRIRSYGGSGPRMNRDSLCAR